MYAIIDVETTGGSPSVDRVIEIAIVIHDGLQLIDQYETLVNPHRPIDKYVTQLTGITDSMVAAAPSWAAIQDKVLELTEGKIFVAHNVKFDYGMLRSEYKRLGIDFVRKQIDTITLARKLMPGFTSYSLGSICDSLGIKIANRHRAMGDVLATVKLLEMMLTEQAANKYIEIELNQGIDPAILPPLITLSEIEKLPEEPGIFYIKNAADEILYIEPSKNVRREVIKFFNRAEHIPERMEAYKAITQIDYQATGHELVAKLQAYHEIKKAVPLYNKKLREVKFSTGIYLVADHEGFKHLQIQPIEGAEGELVLKFQSKGTAFKIMQKIISESFLQVQFSLLKRMTDPEQRSNFQKAYNDKIEKAVKKYLYKQTNFFIIADGRRPDENAVVWVENNVYRGFGYISPELNALTHHNLIAAIYHREDDSEIQKIIRQELKKPKGIKIVGYQIEDRLLLH